MYGTDPSIHCCLPCFQVISSNVIVDTIAITEEADQKIEVLAKVTQGASYFFSDKGDSNALNEAFIALGDRGTGMLR